VNALKTYGIVAAGAVLLVAGVIVLLSQQATAGGALVVSPVDATGPAGEAAAPDPTLGLIVTGIGLVLLAGGVGFLFGRRVPRPAQSRS
jgi:hypothetical protein